MTPGVLPDELRRRAVFLVWGPPGHGPRSRVFSSTLGVPIEFIFSTRRRGGLAALAKYPYQAVRTAMLLWRRRPNIVFVQSPPSFAPAVVMLARPRSRVVIDAHSAALLSPWWTRPEWLYRMVARRAVTTIVTNEHFAERIRSWGAHATVIRDIPTTFDVGPGPADEDGFRILVVSTFAADEPITEVVEAARELDGVSFFVTGDPSRAPQGTLTALPPNVHTTGYLPDDRYYGLMASSDAVMCLTTRDHTMQRGACEALSMGRPIITSDWPLLRDYFNKGTVHVAANSDDIARGVRRLMADPERYEAEIGDLQLEQREEWDSGIASLIDRLTESGAG